jgi:hypothetical protein
MTTMIDSTLSFIHHVPMVCALMLVPTAENEGSFIHEWDCPAKRAPARRKTEFQKKKIKRRLLLRCGFTGLTLLL